MTFLVDRMTGTRTVSRHFFDSRLGTAGSILGACGYASQFLGAKIAGIVAAGISYAIGIPNLVYEVHGHTSQINQIAGRMFNHHIRSDSFEEARDRFFGFRALTEDLLNFGAISVGIFHGEAWGIPNNERWNEFFENTGMSYSDHVNRILEDARQ